MDWAQIISIVVSSGLMMLVMFYYQKLATKKVAKNIDGKIELRMPKINLYVGIFCMLLGLFFFVAMFFEFTLPVVLMASAMIAFFGGIGFWSVVSYYNFSVQYDEEQIIYNSWKNEKTNLRWNEITFAKFSSLSSNLTLSNFDRKIKIPYYVPGFQQFADKMEAKTKFKRKELKLPV